MNLRRYSAFFFMLAFVSILFAACSDTKSLVPAQEVTHRIYRIAVIADPHLWYPEADLSDDDQQVDLPALKFGWLKRDNTNESAVITDAAIADAIEKGAKFIVLNGDVADSAERAVFEALAARLEQVEAEYGVEFFFVRGNHDTPDGEDHEFGVESARKLVDGTVLCNSRNYRVGARELYEIFLPYGLSPYKNGVKGERYIHWERGPAWEHWWPELELTQFSYLVEPVEDLWLLVIDTDSEGWRGLKDSKPQTWAWIKDVYWRAAAEGKTVLAFGHHPLGDPFGGLLFETLGTTDSPITEELKISRENADEMAEAGMTLFVSGHLHMDYIYRHVFNDHAVIDLQVPCLKHYPFGYRMLTLHSDGALDVETHHICDVPGWNQYWDFYKAYAETGDYPWEPYGILETETFEDFVHALWNYQLDKMVTSYIPKALADLLQEVSMYTLLLIAEVGASADARVQEGGRSTAYMKTLYGPGVIPAVERLNEKIGAAGLEEGEIKSLTLYDYAVATLWVQIGAAHALDQMAEKGSLGKYRFCAEFIKNLEIDSDSGGESREKTFDLFNHILVWLIDLADHIWEKPYQGSVRIDLRKGSIKGQESRGENQWKKN